MFQRFIFTFCVWIAATGSVYSENSTTTKRIPLTKCCQDNEVYLVGLDTCRTRKATTKLSHGMIMFPSSRHNIEHRSVDADEFDMRVELSVCPEGKVAVSALDFRFYGDGSLESNTDGILLDPGNFCLHESLPSGSYTARYCLEDHLSSSTRVRKCCPKDMALEGDFCQLSQEVFRPSYHYQNGTPAEENHIVQDSVTPHCYGKRQVFLQSGDYYLLPKGKLFTKNSSQLLQNETWEEIDEYCIEIRRDSTNRISQEAIVCTSSEHQRLLPKLDTELQPFYPYFMFVSASFLAITFIVYVLVPEMRNIHGVPVMCYVACLAVCYIVYGVLQIVNTNINELCRVLAVVVHFMYLSTYAWLNVVCFDICWTLKKMRPTRCINQAIRQPKLGKTCIIYSAYAWLIPLSIVMVGQVLDHLDELPDYIVKPMFNQKTCWFSNWESVLVYVYAPVAVSVFFDILLVVLTAIQLHQAGFGFRGGNSKESSRYGHRLMIIVALFALKMASWITEFLAVLIGYLAGDLLYVVDSIEMVASILTFVIFVCKPSVWEFLRNRYCKCCRSNLSTSANCSKDIILNDISSTPKNCRRDWVYDPSS